MKAAPAGGFYVAGTVVVPTDFGAGPVPASGGGLFLVKVDAHGGLVWSKGYACDGDAEVLEVAASEDRAALVGGFSGGTLDAGTGPMSPGGDRAGFVAVVDTQGQTVWAREFRDEPGASAVAETVAMDADDGVLVGGGYGAALDLGGGPLPAPAADGTAFVARYGAIGQFAWGVALGTGGTDVVDAKSILIDGNGTPWLAGCAGNQSGLVPSVIGSAIFLSRLNPASGKIAWIAGVPAVYATWWNQIDVDSAGDIFGTGSFATTVDFGAGPLVPAKEGTEEGFVVKLAPPR